MRPLILPALALALAAPARAQFADGEALFRRQSAALWQQLPGWRAGVQRISHRRQNGPLQQFQDALVHLVDEAMPAMVTIEDEGGKGSGFFVDKTGLIATNAHVVTAPDEKKEVDVRLKDGRKLLGKVVASDERRDLAFVKVEETKKGWRALKLGDASKVRPGQLVVAIGSPEGFDFSVSLGIISALRNSPLDQFAKVSLFVNFFQTDAALNGGNSGGPLLAVDGTVIGINSMIYTEGGGSEGLGFSISAEDVQAALRQWRRTGNLDAAGIGVNIKGETDAPAGTTGALIAMIREGSPAQTVGLKVGDRIVALDTRPLPPEPRAAAREYLRLMARKSPGETAVIDILRETTRLRFGLAVAAPTTPAGPEKEEEKKEPAT